MIETIQTKKSFEQDIFDPNRIDWRNEERPFTVAVSIATLGESRENQGWQQQRATLAGNMSESYAQPDRTDLDEAKKANNLSVDQKTEMRDAARENAGRFIESCGYDPEQTAIMRPQTDFTGPLGIVDVDNAVLDGGENHATWLKEQGDLIYTRDPEKVLGCRPADCPVLVIHGKDSNGENILAMLHVGWQGLNAGYLEDAMAFLHEQGIGLSSLRIYVGPAANKESFPYTNEHDPRGSGSPRFTHQDRDKLFVDVRQNHDTGKYEFSMDMPGFIHHILTDPERVGLDPEQVAYDGSDVARLDSGYSSNSRATRNPMAKGEVNTRDIIIASMGEPDFSDGIAQAA